LDWLYLSIYGVINIGYGEVYNDGYMFIVNN
jgi:hypothetical protein